MTYKAIVKYMVEREAVRWVEQLLFEAERWNLTTAVDTKFENARNIDSIMWETTVEIVTGRMICETTKVIVGGTFDDVTGLCPSVIWNADKSKTLWGGESLRESLGITEFKLG